MNLIEKHTIQTETEKCFDMTPVAVPDIQFREVPAPPSTHQQELRVDSPEDRRMNRQKNSLISQ